MNDHTFSLPAERLVPTETECQPKEVTPNSPALTEPIAFLDSIDEDEALEQFDAIQCAQPGLEALAYYLSPAVFWAALSMSEEEVRRIFGFAVTANIGMDWPFEEHAASSTVPWLEILSGELEFNSPKEYFDFVARAIGQTGADAAERERHMLEAAERARGLYLMAEDRVNSVSAARVYALGEGTVTVPSAIEKIRALPEQERDRLRERLLEHVSLLHMKYDNVSQFRTPTESTTKFVQKVVVDTTAKAVTFNDENFLALVQEQCFGLPATPRYRDALASFLQPFELPKNAEDTESWRTTVFEKSAKAAQERLKRIFAASDPFLLVRSTIRNETEFVHRDNRRPRTANGQPILSIDDEEGNSASSRMLSQSALAALIGSSLDERVWNEIAVQVDERTAEELKAYLIGGLESGTAQYKHFWRQVKGPSKLRRLILGQKQKGAVLERLLGRVPGGRPTSFWTPDAGWEHTYKGRSLEEWRELSVGLVRLRRKA